MVCVSAKNARGFMQVACHINMLLTT